MELKLKNSNGKYYSSDDVSLTYYYVHLIDSFTKMCVEFKYMKCNPYTKSAQGVYNALNGKSIPYTLYKI